MESVHHRPLKLFTLEGDIYDDSAIWRLKIEYIRLIISKMRLCGYVPRVDINPDFTIQYREEKDCFEFKISLYGIYVGKRKSEWIFGVNESKVMPIQQSKLSEYYQEVE